MSSGSNKPDGDSESSLDLIELVGYEAPKLTPERRASVKTPKAEKKELDRIASEIAMELNTKNKNLYLLVMAGFLRFS